MKNLVIGVHIDIGRDAPGLLDGIVAADRAGLDVAWLTSGGVAPDPLAVFAAATGRTERIGFGTSILQTFPRHPLAMVQGAIAVDQLAPGRVRLGVGPSTQGIVEKTYGIAFERPLGHLREYLIVLKAILQDGAVSHHGERLTAEAKLRAPTKVRVMASALRPNAFRLCGELADGAISWMCPLPYIRAVAAPALAEGASQVGRPKPAMIVHVPMVVSEDVEAVREAARRQFGGYQHVRYYSQMLQDAGFPEAAGRVFSDAMADALVVSGTEDEVAGRIATLPDYGVDEMLAAIVMVGDDPSSADRTLALLGKLARAD